MIIMKDSTPIANEPLTQGDIVHRHGTALPCKPIKVCDAILRVLLEYQKIFDRLRRLASDFNKPLVSVDASKSTWVQTWLFASHLKQALLGCENRNLLSALARTPPVAVKRPGFFSATKPNLRNAP